MTNKQFINRIAKDKSDIVQTLLDMLAETESMYCIIGGLGVNAYVEPVVSLDLDIVIAVDKIDDLCSLAQNSGFKIEKFEHSINLSTDLSDLRIQLQTDQRYQEFIDRSDRRSVLGYEMNVALLEDILKGKIWAFQDTDPRKSKRQKDLADIMRIVESYPELENSLPDEIGKEL
jgi:hypothetical protein